ncbi:SGNH/GDSL hydrolase family protein [Arundinibacter roseus]|uniref:SGNH/GDSL hydrolase family protein n=1 Tax=Arundinibacter roseus TaxID=2070510 RepID=A0A4R4KH80_9BACT|nr:SGNH/GDSL hydrolase family protein [Arundinibacter roseus]TDB67427.1 SGNH/GDSL hydrolase family protein [Arundinibacter roseus]
MIHKTALFLLVSYLSVPSFVYGQMANSTEYLADVKKELQAVWPKNRTINVVFHGHSVPAGFWHDHEVHSLESYPHLVFRKLKEQYPYAVINAIVTAVGGENSQKGEARLEEQVLVYRPDVLLIDYALNDRFLGLEKSKEAWESMIQKALAKNIKVILITPSPDQRVNLLEADNLLDQHARQIRLLAEKYGLGLADPYAEFKKIASTGTLPQYMSHVNHPNLKGHEIIAQKVVDWFIFN